MMRRWSGVIVLLAIAAAVIARPVSDDEMSARIKALKEAPRPALQWSVTVNSTQGPTYDAALSQLYVATTVSTTAYAAATGRVVWRVPGLGPSGAWAKPVVALGRVYLAGARGITALDAATGRTVWAQQVLDFGSLGSPVVSVKSNAVFFSFGWTFYALDAATGAVRWTSHMYPNAASYILAFDDATLVFESEGGKLRYANTTDGSVLRTVTAGWNGLSGNPIAFASSIRAVLVPQAQIQGNEQNGVLGFNAVGDVVTRMVSDGTVASGVAVAAEVSPARTQRCYFSDDDGTVYAADAKTGATVWARGVFLSAPSPITPLLPARGGSSVVVAGGGLVAGLGSATGALQWAVAVQKIRPVVARGPGRVFFSDEATLYAYVAE